MNLNLLLASRQSAHIRRGETKIKIIFNPVEISTTIIHLISNDYVTSTVGALAWLTNDTIINTIATKPSAIVVTDDKINRRNRKKYKKMKPIEREKKAVKLFGVKVKKRSRFAPQPTMHHKFLVLLHKNKPFCVLTGSFNFTKNALNNIENLSVIHDHEIAQIYYDEFQRIWECF